MILSVCPHTALDRVMFIDEWIPGTPMRTDKIVTSVGGKGLNSAVVLSHLGVETVAVGFFAGVIGQELLDVVESYGITVDPVWVNGTNRVAHVIAEQRKNIHSHVIAGKVQISEDQEIEFFEKYRFHLQTSDYVIIGGTIPPVLNQDFNARLVELAKQANVPVLVDAQNQAMIEVVKVKPDIVKMNWEEFEWTFDLKAQNINELKELAISFYQKNELKNLVLTLSKDGILSLTEEGIFFAKAPLQKPVNAAGAGDAVSSTLAWRFSQGDDWKSAMHWASAVSAASVLTERTGDVHSEDIERIFPLVIVEKW